MRYEKSKFTVSAHWRNPNSSPPTPLNKLTVLSLFSACNHGKTPSNTIEKEQQEKVRDTLMPNSCIRKYVKLLNSEPILYNQENKQLFAQHQTSTGKEPSSGWPCHRETDSWLAGHSHFHRRVMSSCVAALTDILPLPRSEIFQAPNRRQRASYMVRCDEPCFPGPHFKYSSINWWTFITDWDCLPITSFWNDILDPDAHTPPGDLWLRRRGAGRKATWGIGWVIKLRYKYGCLWKLANTIFKHHQSSALNIFETFTKTHLVQN